VVVFLENSLSSPSSKSKTSSRMAIMDAVEAGLRFPVGRFIRKLDARLMFTLLLEEEGSLKVIFVVLMR
jgi:hypothetical protein